MTNKINLAKIETIALQALNGADIDELLQPLTAREIMFVGAYLEARASGGSLTHNAARIECDILDDIERKVPGHG